MSRQVLTQFDPDKKSAVLRQKISLCTAAFIHAHYCIQSDVQVGIDWNMPKMENHKDMVHLIDPWLSDCKMHAILFINIIQKV